MGRDGNVSGSFIEDGKIRKCMLSDTEGNTGFLYLKSCEGENVWYVKSREGSFIQLPKDVNLKAYIGGNKLVVQPMNKTTRLRENTVEFLCEICPFFRTLIPDIQDDLILEEIPEGKKLYTFDSLGAKYHSKVVKGHMQSGKTWLMICIAIYYYIQYRISTIIVVQNTLDAFDQIYARLEGIRDSYAQFTEQKLDHIQYLNSARGKTVKAEEILRALDGTIPQIFIALRSDTDIDPLCKVISSSPFSERWALILDESDYNDSGAISTSQASLSSLKDMSGVVWNVTATPITSMAKERIHWSNVYTMPVPEGYKDLATFTYRDIGVSKYCTEVDENPFNTVPLLKDYIKDLAKTCPFDVPLGKGLKHPVITLIRVSFPVEPNLKVAEYIDAVYGDRITTITYNGGGIGITLRGVTLPQSPISFEDGTQSIFENGIHKIPPCHIGKIIEYLQSQGVHKHKRIAILAGKKADRGITFGSGNYNSESIPWHLTEMFLVASKSTNQGNLLQIAGRLCGVYKDNIPLTVFSNACADIIKAYHAQEELIHRAIQKGAECGESILDSSDSPYMRDLLPQIPLAVKKCCKKRRFTASRVPLRICKVENDHGWNWEAEGRKIPVIQESMGNGDRSKVEFEDLYDPTQKFQREEAYEDEILINRECLKGDVAKSLFDRVYAELTQVDEGWVEASRFYKESGDRQNMWHWYKKHDHDEGDYNLILKKDERNRLLVRMG